MSFIEKLGFAPEERVVVVHVDDLGMSGPANAGGLLAIESGAATCGSIMVPCPGFAEAAERTSGESRADVGVHLTLNAEYETFRWGPCRDDVPGLVSGDGAMWRTSAETVANASADEVERELRAQIRRALDAHIDVTHIDSHMGTVFDLKFARVYFSLAREFALPAFVPRVRRELLPEHGLPDAFEDYLRLIDDYESGGFPVFDHFCADSLEFEPGTGAAHNRARLENFGPGLSFLITHCAQGGDPLAEITPNDWRQRDEERQIYSDGTMAQVIADADIRTIGMREIRDAMRG